MRIQARDDVSTNCIGGAPKIDGKENPRALWIDTEQGTVELLDEKVSTGEEATMVPRHVVRPKTIEFVWKAGHGPRGKCEKCKGVNDWKTKTA